MNKLIFLKLASFFAFALLVVFSCKKDDNYDWNAVEPGKQKISRADADTSKIKLDSVKGDNISIRSYVAISRGGSKYKWIAGNNFLKIIERPTAPFWVDIKAESRVDTAAWLWVQETTKGGKTSQPDSMRIIIFGFCQYNISELLGNGKFISKMAPYAPYKVNLNKIDGDTIVNDNFFSMKWPLKYVLSKDHHEIITIVKNQRFIYNGETVEVNGSGTYNTCKSRFEIKFAITRLIINDTISLGSGTDILTLDI